MIKLITFLVFTIGLNFFPTFVYAADPNANNPLSNIINIGATPPVQSSTNPSLGGAPTATIPAPTATIPAPTASGSTPQSNDYANNIKSNVFGANLFTGSFAVDGATQFNPNYLIAVGDNIQVTLWGAYSYSAVLTVDPKGNIFIPNLGPFRVMGIRNSQLQKFFELTVAKTFKSNVNAYISLAMAQPVKVFVSGFVNRPGLYSGTSMDNLLHFIDEAGGIDPERGSFINIKI
jgi:protein involved in polysaccharide export with SLBB domain